MRSTSTLPDRALSRLLAAQAMEGDRAAFDELYRLWHPSLSRLAQRLTRDRDLAQDVMQDAALTIARNISKLATAESFGAWAYTIVRRRAADQIKSRVKQRDSLTVLENQPTAQSERQNYSDLYAALADLPDTDRLLLTLFYVEGLTGPELAAALGIPVGTVKSRLFAARQSVRTFLSPPQSGDHHE